MKSFFNILLALTIVACSVSALFSSCVRPEYELSEDNLNLDMTLFQEGIVFPLGNTVPFTLGELYGQYGQELKDYLKYLPAGDALHEFDDDYKVGIVLTSDDIPEVLTELVVSGDVGLGGSVTNGLPLQFDMEFQFLGSDGNAIPLAAGAARQVIKPCALDGTPTVTKLTAVQSLKTDAKASEIVAVRLVFMASAALPGSAGFKEDSSLQANLHAILPKGLSLNWNDLSQLDENITGQEGK